MKITCGQCGLTHEDTVLTCDCGHDLRPQTKALQRSQERVALRETATTALYILAPVGLILLAVWLFQISRRPSNEEIFAEVRPFFEQCESIQDSAPAISRRGRALVLDVGTGADFIGWHRDSYIADRSFPHAGTFDRKITVFLVATQRQGYLGNYRLAVCGLGLPALDDGACAGASAYRARYDVCVVHWPERQVVGMHTLMSIPPRELGNAFSGEIVGEPIDVYAWIESLPTADD